MNQTSSVALERVNNFQNITNANGISDKAPNFQSTAGLVQKPDTFENFQAPNKIKIDKAKALKYVAALVATGVVVAGMVCGHRYFKSYNPKVVTKLP